MNSYLSMMLLIFVSAEKIFSQDISYQPLLKNFSLTAQVNYVSSASIQLYAFSPSEFERNIIVDIGGGYGYSGVIKTNLPGDNLSIALSVEYISIIDDQNSIYIQSVNGPSIRARLTETLEVIPVELSVLFNIPYLSDDLNIYLGGGSGVYFGNWKRKVLGTESETISKKPGFRFHVLSGIQYSFLNDISAGFEVRFREGSYEVSTEFPKDEFIIEGNTYNIEKSYSSRIFLDGLRLTFGVSFYF